MGQGMVELLKQPPSEEVELLKEWWNVPNRAETRARRKLERLWRRLRAKPS